MRELVSARQVVGENSPGEGRRVGGEAEDTVFQAARDFAGFGAVERECSHPPRRPRTFKFQCRRAAFDQKFR